ncbi:TrkA family potassium uptake protein [Candidatus Woesearchaeota archaeon]|nr:TrkA family potassium uptake protein [Candidatus Woesearchaeota archaeon]
MKKTFGVIGLGRFGSSVALTLAKLGYTVIAGDKEELDIQHIKDYVSYAVQIDATDIESLREAGFKNCDVVIVAIGEDIQSSILATANLKDIGIKYIVAKAQSEQQGRILAKIGADRIIYPEHDSGVRLANQLTQSDILEFIEVSPEYIVKEIKVPSTFVGRSLRDLQLPNKYRILVLAIKRGRMTHIIPSVDERAGLQDVFVIVGKRDDVIHFMKKFKLLPTREGALRRVLNTAFRKSI